MTKTNVVYEGTGQTLEQAVERAHAQIPSRKGRDFAISQVIDWGMQRGGIADSVLYWVKLMEDEHAPLKA